MKVKNNYNECITNVACSIQKYFGVNYMHNTIEYLDNLFNEKTPKNVVVLLLDGMGSRLIPKVLDNNSFFMKNMVKEITTVFPATTVAATTSIRTGLNPVEHGNLGWYMYFKPLDKIMSVFINEDRDTNKLIKKFDKLKNKYLSPKTVVEQINYETKYKAKEIAAFNNPIYKDFNKIIDKIKFECKREGKKYIYAYYEEPDHSLHSKGINSEEVKNIVINLNNKVEEMCKELEDTIVIVIADHGHTLIENICLDDYPEIINMLGRNISSEPRACIFKIKDGMHKAFEEKFNELFGEYFTLYSKEEVINSKLYGEGKEHPLFREALGDYIAIAENSNKAFYRKGEKIFVSHHAGYLEEEIYIPLIIVDKTNK